MIVYCCHINFLIFLALKEILQTRLKEIEAAGTYKRERVITSPQKHLIKSEGKEVLNFCANNYLGLADNKQVRHVSLNLFI